METNALSKYHLCEPHSCPMISTCPRGPTPNAPCFVKDEYGKYVDQVMAQVFTGMEKSPEATLRINILLKPLFEQLLKLRMAELGFSVFTGVKISSIYSEIRKCIMAINTVLSETVKSYKVDVPDKKKIEDGGALGVLQGKGYYEMLCYDGNASVEDRVGPN